MPDEVNIRPIETPGAPVKPEPSSKIKFYVACGTAALFALAFIVYFGKYRVSEKSLVTVTSSYNDTKSQLEENKKEFSDYQKRIESNTSWTKDTFYENGRLKTRVVYSKNALSTFSGATTLVSNTTSSTDSNTRTNSTSTARERTQEGVPINGVVYVSIPFDTFAGNFKSFGLGFMHNTIDLIIIDPWVGMEAGTNDITAFEKNLYLKLQVGAGIK